MVSISHIYSFGADVCWMKTVEGILIRSAWTWTWTQRDRDIREACGFPGDTGDFNLQENKGKLDLFSCVFASTFEDEYKKDVVAPLKQNNNLSDAKGPDAMFTKVESLLHEAVENCLVMDDVPMKDDDEP